jgi:hypothetical protein
VIYLYPIVSKPIIPLFGHTRLKGSFLRAHPRPLRRMLCLERVFAGLAIVACLLSFACSVLAQTGAETAPADLDQMVHNAAIVLRGHVVSAAMEPHPQFPNLQTVVVTIAVEKVMKGQAPSTYSFRQFVWNPREPSVSGDYRKSTELLLFLNPVSTYGLTSPVGLDQGRFRVVRDSKGQSYAINGRSNIGLFSEVVSKASARGLALSRPVQAMAATRQGQVPLDTLEDAITALARGRS